MARPGPLTGRKTVLGWVLGERMTERKYDQAFWEQLWTRTLREHSKMVERRPPNAYLVAEAAKLPPGRALDAGCGHGAETLWLAGQGWKVTAVDFSAAALAQGRSMADAAGLELAQRIDWLERDLGTWSPESEQYDLVFALYVHVAGSVGAFVQRLASAVAPGGTLLLVGHRPIDPQTGAATQAAGQVQVSVEDVTSVLDPGGWSVLLAEERVREVAGSGVDAVIVSRRGV